MAGRSACLGLFFFACVPPVYLSGNIALGKPTAMGTYIPSIGVSSHAVDGNKNPDFSSYSCVHSHGSDENPWWTVDLLNVYTIQQVVIYNRNQEQARLDNVYVEGFLVDPFMCSSGDLCAPNPGGSGSVVTLNCSPQTRARYIRLRKISEINLVFCEVEIFGDIAPAQGPTFPFFQPLCWQMSIERIAGQKLTSSLDLANASNILDCLRVCQRRPTCVIFNYNNVTSACSTPAGLMSNDIITSSEEWNLYYPC